MSTSQYVFSLGDETHKRRKKRNPFCILLLLKGFFYETFLCAKTMQIHADVTICGWPTLTNNSRGGWELLLEVTLSYIKRYFWDVLMKIPCFYCNNKRPWLFHSINSNLNFSKITFWMSRKYNVLYSRNLITYDSINKKKVNFTIHFLASKWNTQTKK